MVSASPAPPPERVGRFEIEAELGAGASGVVWLARDPDLLRQVAVKVLRPGLKSAADLDRFLLEGRIASQLDHPGIVPIHELGVTSDGSPFLVMRRVQGRAMAEVLRSRRDDPASAPPLHRLLSAFVRACEAVGYAHGRGIVHRDLKPQNLLLGEHGEVLVVDWGLAGWKASGQGRADILTGGRGATQDQALVGTLGYLPPEALFGAPAATRADVFGLGAVLYEILTGRFAIDGEDLVEATCRLAIVDPRVHAPELDEGLVAICLRALERDPAARFADAQAMAEALVGWEEGTERRARAERAVAEGARLLARFVEREGRLEALEAETRDRTRAVAAWLPLDAPEKRVLHEAREALETGRVEQAEAFAEVLGSAEAALRADPAHPGALELMAEAMEVRLRAAERRGDRVEEAYYRNRLSRFDAGPRLARFGAAGSLSLRTEPAARVTARPVIERGVCWSLGEPVDLGMTPLRAAPLAAGSWVLTLAADGRPPIAYPVRIARSEECAVHAEAPLAIPDRATLGGEWVFVPGGPFVAGGDAEVNVPRPPVTRWMDDLLIARFPVTVGEYAAFLDDLWMRDADLAWSRVPRDFRGGEGTQLWPRRPQGGWTFPLADRDGDRWEATWPVAGISWYDGLAFARWRSEREGRRIGLVAEDAYEKAARGVDGRRFPWGNQWDAALCKNLHSRQGTPRPEPVGAFPTDTSPYGVRDLAGGMRTWCAEDHFDGDPALRPMRGGFWGCDHRMCRAANRYGIEPGAAMPYLGLRLTCSTGGEG